MLHIFLVAALVAFWLALFATFTWLFAIWLPRTGKPRDPDDELRPQSA